MSLEKNKKLAREFLEASCMGNTSRMRDMTTDDFTWWVMPSTPYSGIHQKEEFLSMIPQIFSEADGSFTMRFDEFTAEDDRVSVTAKGHLKLKNGKVYASDYHILLFLRDGKVARGKEYMDTAHVAEVFGS